MRYFCEDHSQLCYECEAYSQLCYECEAHSQLCYEYEAHSQLCYECEAHSQLCYECEAYSQLCYECEAHSQLCYECETHSRLCYGCEAHSHLHYKCEAHSHLNYNCEAHSGSLSIILELSFTQEMRGDSDPPPSKDHPTSLSNSDSLQQHSTSPVDLQSNQEDVVSVNNFTITRQTCFQLCPHSGKKVEDSVIIKFMC